MKNKGIKYYIRLETERENICQEVTKEVYIKINEYLKRQNPDANKTGLIERRIKQDE